MTKLIRYLPVIFAVVLSITACDGKKGKSSEVVVNEQTTESKTSAGNNICDSTYQQLVKRMGKISDRTAAIETELHVQDNQVKVVKKSIDRWRVIAMAAIALAVITLLLLTLYYKRKIKQLAKESDGKFRDLKSRLEGMGGNFTQWQKVKSDVVPSMESRYRILEERVSKLEKNIVEANPCPKNNVVPPQVLTDKVGYVRSNVRDMFTEVFPSKGESCIYKIKLINDHEGEFDLIDSTKLTIMRQTSYYKDVVKVVEECPLTEATKYGLISPGKCIKTGEGKDSVWKVTEKLTIKTLK